MAVTVEGSKIRAHSFQASAPVTGAWNHCVILLLVTGGVYFQTWADLWPLWNNKNATYTHGVLIAALFLWLVWRSRAKLAGVPVLPDPRLLPLVLILSLAWLLLARANIRIAHSMLWPVLAFTVLWAGCGWRVARVLAFPLGFLYFAIPFWDYLEPALQAIASNVVGFLIRMSGTQASVNGPYILLPSTTIHIALTCSGAHFLAVSLAMGALAGEIRGDDLRTRILIMALAGLLSIVFNSVRILLIVLAHMHPTLQNAFEAIGHLTFGWWVFALDVLVLVLVLRMIPLSPRRPVPPPVADPVADTRKGWLYAALAAAVMLPALSWMARRLDHYPAPPAAPLALSDTARPIAPDLRWQPEYGGVAWQHRVAYISPRSHVLELYRNEYHGQSEGNELVSAGSKLFDVTAFSIGAPERTKLVRAGAPPIDVNRVALTDPSGRTWSALYTYLVDDDAIARAWRAQLLAAWRSLYSRPAAGVLALAAPCVPDCAAVDEDLEALALRAYAGYEAKARHR